MISDLGMCLGLWGFLKSVGTMMGEGWLGHLQKSESTVTVLQVFGCENMNIPVHKNRATSQCSGQNHDVPES